MGEAGGGGGSDVCPTPQITSWTMTLMDATNDSAVQRSLEWNDLPGDGTATGSVTFDSFPYTLTGLADGFCNGCAR